MPVLFLKMALVNISFVCKVLLFFFFLSSFPFPINAGHIVRLLMVEIVQANVQRNANLNKEYSPQALFLSV